MKNRYNQDHLVGLSIALMVNFMVGALLSIHMEMELSVSWYFIALAIGSGLMALCAALAKKNTSL